MTPEEQNEVEQLIRAIPQLANLKSQPKRLGGLTNRVYAVGDYVLRIPGKGTDEYINRANEAAMATESAAAGVSPEVIHVDPKSGVMVSKRVEGATMSPELFKATSGAVERAGKVLQQLHRSEKQFPSRFELFAVLDDYCKIVASKNVALPAGYDDVMKEAQAIRNALLHNPVKRVPCHCDPLCENFIDTGSRMWIVDWEYGGMNDAMWDLGDLSVEGGFTPEQDETLLRAYFLGEASKSNRGRMVIYKAMCDLLWAVWGLVQHANQNPADDFTAYALNRFNRCKSLMATKDFACHLAAIGK